MTADFKIAYLKTLYTKDGFKFTVTLLFSKKKNRTLKMSSFLNFNIFFCFVLLFLVYVYNGSGYSTVMNTSINLE